MRSACGSALARPGGTETTAGEHLDQHLVDALSFVRELPGIEIVRERRVEDVHSIVVRLDNPLPLLQGLGQSGWRVQMTGERIRARKGALAIYGKFIPTGVELQVRPESNSLDAERRSGLAKGSQHLLGSDIALSWSLHKETKL